jgi:hypothetical protein
MKYWLLGIAVAGIVYLIVCRHHTESIYPDMRVAKKDVDSLNPWPYVECENGDRIYLFT